MTSSEPGRESLAEMVAGLRNAGDMEGRAVEILSRGAEAVPYLSEFLLGPPDPLPEPRQVAARLLGVIGTPIATRELEKTLFLPVRALPDPVLRLADETVAETAADVLRKLAEPAAIPSLRLALQRFSLVNAAEALAAMDDEPSIPLMIDALNDDFHRGRIEDAILSFGKKALPALIRARGTAPRSDSGPGSRRQESIDRIVAAIRSLEEGKVS